MPGFGLTFDGRGFRVLVVCLVCWAAWVRAEMPALLLAETYRGQVDVTQYLVSEKFDGVRAYWNGRQLISRGGNVIQAPQWFTAGLPVRQLDGELWLGAGRFEEMSGLARRELPDDDAWQQVSYLVFELPDGEGTFIERFSQLQALARSAGAPWLRVVEQTRVSSSMVLMRRLDAVISAGGEGLMLHRADAPYLTGRSDVLLKVKRWHDAEAVVVAHVPGKGKYRGALGALRVRTEDGREFLLGTGFTDRQRRSPPPVGSTVTYRYRELTARGIPRSASFWRVRADS